MVAKKMIIRIWVIVTVLFAGACMLGFVFEDWRGNFVATLCVTAISIALANQTYADSPGPLARWIARWNVSVSGLLMLASVGPIALHDLDPFHRSDVSFRSLIAPDGFLELFLPMLAINFLITVFLTYKVVQSAAPGAPDMASPLQPSTAGAMEEPLGSSVGSE